MIIFAVVFEYCFIVPVIIHSLSSFDLSNTDFLFVTFFCFTEKLRITI